MRNNLLYGIIAACLLTLQTRSHAFKIKQGLQSLVNKAQNKITRNTSGSKNVPHKHPPHHNSQGFVPFSKKLGSQTGKFLSRQNKESILELLANDAPSIRDIRGVNLPNLNLTNGAINNKDLSNAYMPNMTVNNTKITDSNLERAILRFMKGENLSIENTRMNMADMRGAVVNKGWFNGSDLRGLDMRNGNFGRMVLRNANILGIKRDGSTFKNTELYGAVSESINVGKANKGKKTPTRYVLDHEEMNRINEEAWRTPGGDDGWGTGDVRYKTVPEPQSSFKNEPWKRPSGKRELLVGPQQ